MKSRIIVVAIIQNLKGEYLLCKMSKNRGVFPGQWGLPGGGIDPNENMYDALKREIFEELGITLDSASPWSFNDDKRIKTYPDKSAEKLYMIYLMFDCVTSNTSIKLNAEFDEYAWVSPEQLEKFDLNIATKKTFEAKGLISEEITVD